MPQWHTFYSNFLLSWKWLMFNPWLFWAIKLKFLTGRACGRDETRWWADECCWFWDRFERALANFAILNQIIIIFGRTQTFDWNLNLLCVYLGHAKRFVTEIFSIALITCFVLTGKIVESKLHFNDIYILTIIF